MPQPRQSISAPRHSVAEHGGEYDFEPPPKPKAKWRIWMGKVVDHYIIVIIMTVITIYALFFDDIRIVLVDGT